MKKILLLLLIVISFESCKKQENTNLSSQTTKKEIVDTLQYATGFQVQKYTDYTIITLSDPFPNASKSYIYALVKRGKVIPKNVKYDQLVTVPIQKIVVTSTTHIPALEDLGVLNKLIGFPNTKFISSKKARALIDQGKIKDLGKNENINTEILIDIQPDVVIGFGVNGDSKTFDNIQKAGIPVLYNGEWVEKHALGRAEWIKFFGHLFNKEKEANAIFKQIETNYLSAKKIAQTAKNRPTVLSGSMFKDTWYVPKGESWGAKFITDANAQYLWADTKGTGSMGLNIESVLEKAQHADYWISVGSYQTKSDLLAANQHYQQFDMYQNNHIYMANKKGATGGLLFYEKGPTRPDLILKDLIKIFHPELLPNYDLYFYHPLN